MVIEQIAIVVPIRDEEELLPRCLAAISRAVENVPKSVKVSTMLVLDSCSDRSGAITEMWSFDTLTVAANTVGCARAEGVSAVLARSRIGLDSFWIANTDADSAVPRDWLTHQLEIADAGAALVLGAIRPDETGFSIRQRQRWYQMHPSGISHGGDVYGANLGIRGSAYRAVGGFEAVSEDEDVGLVARVRDAGLPIVATRGHPVLTSSRVAGRTPGGYARYLREDLLNA
ncbi:glycosyltransferase [Homoserinimonas sp. OAct 916]|uniref:glycosyltransferase n=1 Tax=Homoserinimonas sp. OAct 916 TaxID=2211450 RepID=UPI000DBE9A0A|nr:glycosyltransferase [Homoserinimonas sp. OAct 916]